MKFNKFVWQLYAKSERGKNAIRKFLRLTSKSHFLQPDDNWYQSGEFVYPISEWVQIAADGETFRDLQAASRYYRNTLVKKGFPIQENDKRGRVVTAFTFPKRNSDWYDCIAAVSFGLYKAHPDFFLPYNFRCRFNQLEEIHAEFEIPLPPSPGKGDKNGRAVFYAAINEAWQAFRILHSLSPAEMCAFLYDFAQQLITPLDTSDLPSPSKVWLTTGESDDIKFSDRATPETVTRWGGSVDIRRGDIVLLYLVSPRKTIDSIWRAGSDGFVDPFFHYHGTVWICDQIKTKPVGFADLTGHPLLSQNSAVRGKFFGATGKASLSVEEYKALLAIMKKKGQDISLLPQIPKPRELPTVELQNERDVEIHLIEPFLQRLGYNDSDWVRQMPVTMGRGERNYPDYAFGANPKRGKDSAKMVLESKFQLSARREITKAFNQTRSYALRLKSKMMAMAARQGVWVFPQVGGDYDIKNCIQKSWGELNNPDAFRELLRLISRDVILRGRVAQMVGFCGRDSFGSIPTEHPFRPTARCWRIAAVDAAA